MASSDSISRANAPCHPFLAFLNTVSDDGKTRTENIFGNKAQLCDILTAAGVDLGPKAAERMDLAMLIAFREAAFRTLSAYAAKRTPSDADMHAVESILKRALASGEFHLDRNGFQVTPHPDGGVIDHLALQYIDLVNGPEFYRLKECQRCTKLFLDHGRGRGRRWCDMALCGNRAKAESFRARKKGALVSAGADVR